MKRIAICIPVDPARVDRLPSASEIDNYLFVHDVINVEDDYQVKEGEVLLENGERVGSGYFYNKQTDDFIPMRPFASWVFNGKEYEAPVPYPANSSPCVWNEEIKNWQSLTIK